MSRRTLALAGLGLLLGCEVAPPPAEAPVVHAIYDPGAGRIPLPNDALRDAEQGRLALPSAPEDLEGRTPAEAAFVRALNRMDAWPRGMPAELTFSGPLDPGSIGPGAVRIFEDQDGALVAVDAAVLGSPQDAPTSVVIRPPEGGWKPGARYVVAALGAQDGLRGAGGEEVVGDAAFYFLRLQEDLTAHADALPGETPEARAEAAAGLEALRRGLAPRFERLEALGVAREGVVALWDFTASARVTVVMDAEAGRMPLPSDFLRNPASGRVELPVAPGDSEGTRHIKAALNRLDGFGLSSGLTFELSAPVDPSSVTPETVRLFAVPEAAPPYEVPVEVRTRVRDTAVTVTPSDGPLAPATDHVLVVSSSVSDPLGAPVGPMLPGLFIGLDAPLYADGASQHPSLDAESAARLEPIRARLEAGLERLALDDAAVAVAWPFRTMTVFEPMRQHRDAARIMDTPVDPFDVEDRSPAAAALDFPLSALTLLRVRRVYEGKIVVPDFLDPVTRAAREDGGWAPREVKFVMTVPRGLEEGAPMPVAIFGHGLMTERRFVLALADALAGEGIAAVAIDLPFHGERTHCVWKGPQCVVNPLDPTGDQICPSPCARNTTCSPDGRCVDSAGEGNHLATWPLVGFPQASGGAFVDVDSMDGTRDHLYQAVTDLSALYRSLREGDWASVVGHEIDPDISYVGQSLGGVLGALFVAVHPEVKRAVLNVPGSDLIDLFRESTVFAPHFEAYLDNEGIARGSEEHERVLNVARWLMDSVDPQSFAQFLLRESFEPGRALPEDRTVLIQMARLDLVIPNATTELLARLSGAPKEDYLAEHAFIVIPVEPAYLRGTRDLARVLGRGELP